MEITSLSTSVSICGSTKALLLGRKDVEIFNVHSSSRYLQLQWNQRAFHGNLLKYRKKSSQKPLVNKKMLVAWSWSFKSFPRMQAKLVCSWTQSLLLNTMNVDVWRGCYCTLPHLWNFYVMFCVKTIDTRSHDIP